MAIAALLDASPDPLVILDRHGVVAHCNPAACRLFGWDDAVIGLPIAAVVERTNAAGRTLLHHLTAGDTRSRGRRTFTLEEGGHPRHFDVQLTAFDRDGGAWRAATLRDVTELHAARSALARAKSAAEAASRAKTHFLARTSHEVRTPLNAIVGFSDAILHGVHGPLRHEKYASYVKDIHAAGVHLLALINDVFDIARVEAGQLNLWEEPIDIVDLVARTISFIRPIAVRADVEIRFDAALPGVRLTVDPRRIRQVLINVLSNAIKFSPRGAQVRVSALPTAPRGLAIVVADRGCGIDQAIADKIGTEYITSAKAGGPRHDGTGLGLPVSFALMRAHDGELRIDSPRGEGTTVSLLFPADRVSPAQESVTGRGRGPRDVRRLVAKAG